MTSESRIEQLVAELDKIDNAVRHGSRNDRNDYLTKFKQCLDDLEAETRVTRIQSLYDQFSEMASTAREQWKLENFVTVCGQCLHQEEEGIYGFRWNENSCYIDTLLAVMFTTTRKFDFIFKKESNLALELKERVAKLRDNSLRAEYERDPESGGTCSSIRELLGERWKKGADDAAALFSELFTKLKILRLFKIKTTTDGVVTTRGYITLPLHVGEHTKVTDLFSARVSQNGQQTRDELIVEKSPVFVCEVERGNLKTEVDYGTHLLDGSVVLTINSTTYLLKGVVSYFGGHYVGFMWHRTHWYYYDDLGEAQLERFPSLKKISGPHRPSRTGQLFFYERQK